VVLKEKTGQELWTQYQESPGNVTMTNGDFNQALMAVLQCLMNCDELARHTLFSTYKKGDGPYPVSDMLFKLFSEIYRKPTTESKKSKLDIRFVAEEL